jgi:hypothetical protein
MRQQLQKFTYSRTEIHTLKQKNQMTVHQTAVMPLYTFMKMPSTTCIHKIQLTIIFGNIISRVVSHQLLCGIPSDTTVIQYCKSRSKQI